MCQPSLSIADPFISASKSNYKLPMGKSATRFPPSLYAMLTGSFFQGSPKAVCYLASPEVVAASAIQGKIAGPGWYSNPKGVVKIIFCEGTSDFVADKARSVEDAFGQIIGEMESMISAPKRAAEQSASPAVTEDEASTDVVPGFAEKVEGEIVFRE